MNEGRLPTCALWLVAALLPVAACADGPVVPPAEASAAIAAWLPAANAEVLATESRDGGAEVRAEVNGEPMRFRFAHDEGEGWELAGMVTDDGDVLDRAATLEAWLQVLRTPREVSLAEIVAGRRPEAPLEVVITDLRVASVTEERMRLESTTDPGQVVVVGGRHLDELPVTEGERVGLQVQGLAREGDHWVPVRREPPGELMMELEPIDVTLLAVLKLRLADRVVPIPYEIPDMEHEHGA